MQKLLLKKKHHKQELKTSCVPAAALMVLNFLKANIKDEAYLRKILKTKPIGTNVANLFFLKDQKELNLEVTLESLSIDELNLFLIEKQSPVIVIVDTSFLSSHDIKASHAVIVVGFEKEKIIINDPWFDEKEIHTDIDEFKLAWGKFDNLTIKIFKKTNGA